MAQNDSYAFQLIDRIKELEQENDRLKELRHDDANAFTVMVNRFNEIIESLKDELYHEREINENKEKEVWQKLREIDYLEGQVEDLKTKIGKMKNCENCRHYEFVEAYQQKECHNRGCVNKDKWEMKE